jgi:hypothetical protein
MRPVGIGRGKRGEEKGTGDEAGGGRTVEIRAGEGRQRRRERESIGWEERESPRQKWKGFPKWKLLKTSTMYSNPTSVNHNFHTRTPILSYFMSMNSV